MNGFGSAMPPMVNRTKNTLGGAAQAMIPPSASLGRGFGNASPMNPSFGGSVGDAPDFVMDYNPNSPMYINGQAPAFAPSRPMSRRINSYGPGRARTRGIY